MLVGRLVGLLLGPLEGRLVGWLAGGKNGRLLGRLAGLLDGLLVGLLVGFVVAATVFFDFPVISEDVGRGFLANTGNAMPATRTPAASAAVINLFLPIGSAPE